MTFYGKSLLTGDYPYLFSRVAGQSHWPSLQTKPPNMIGLLPSFGANKPLDGLMSNLQSVEGVSENSGLDVRSNDFSRFLV